MKKPTTLEEALLRINELETKITELQEELDYYKNRRTSGRKKHNDKWLSTYHDFIICHEQGMSVREIADQIGISERSVFRYKAYYRKSLKNE